MLRIPKWAFLCYLTRFIQSIGMCVYVYDIIFNTIIFAFLNVQKKDWYLNAFLLHSSDTKIIHFHSRSPILCYGYSYVHTYTYTRTLFLSLCFSSIRFLSINHNDGCGHFRQKLIIMRKKACRKIYRINNIIVIVCNMKMPINWFYDCHVFWAATHRRNRVLSFYFFLDVDRVHTNKCKIICR